MNNSKFVEILSTLRPSSTFLWLKGYRNDAGEVADHSIVFHMSYLAALLKSIGELSSYDPIDKYELLAKQELLTSFRQSIDRMEATPIEEIDDGYMRFFDEEHNYIKGVKLHLDTGVLHLYGLHLKKHVYIPGEYKVVNSKPLTLAKNKLRKLTTVCKFRQFKITPFNVASIAVEHYNIATGEPIQ